MFRRWMRAAALAAAAAVLLLGLCAALSRALWHRSLQASVYEALLWRRFATDRTAETEIERLERRRAEGETPYALPESVHFSVDARREAVGGMDCFILNGGADTAVIYLHGGAYINQFNGYQWHFMDRLAAEADVEVLAPVYRVAPFGSCEAAYADLTAFYRACCARRPGSRTLLMGDSAGGGLALGLAEHFAREELPLPERLILFSPWVDVTMENPDIADCVAVDPILHLELVRVHGRYWADALDPHDWRVSPLFGDMSGLPPVTFYSGTRELLWPDARLLAEALADAGVPVDFKIGEGLNHDYPLMPIPEGRRAAAEAIALCRGIGARD